MLALESSNLFLFLFTILLWFKGLHCYSERMAKDLITNSLIYSYDEHHDNAPRYCEFITKEQFKDEKGEDQTFEICFTQNQDMVLNRDGKKYYPYHGYSEGSYGIILECDTPKNVTLHSCTYRNNIYSRCNYTCHRGLEAIHSFTECQLHGPRDDISAKFTNIPLCKGLDIDNTIGKSTDQADGESNFLVIAGSIFAAVVLVIVFTVFVKCYRRGKKRSKDLTGKCLEEGEREGIYDTSGETGLAKDALLSKPNCSDLSNGSPITDEISTNRDISNRGISNGGISNSISNGGISNGDLSNGGASNDGVSKGHIANGSSLTIERERNPAKDLQYGITDLSSSKRYSQPLDIGEISDANAAHNLVEQPISFGSLKLAEKAEDKEEAPDRCTVSLGKLLEAPHEFIKKLWELSEYIEGGSEKNTFKGLAKKIRSKIGIQYDRGVEVLQSLPQQYMGDPKACIGFLTLMAEHGINIGVAIDAFDDMVIIDHILTQHKNCSYCSKSAERTRRNGTDHENKK